MTEVPVGHASEANPPNIRNPRTAQTPLMPVNPGVLNPTSIDASCIGVAASPRKPAGLPLASVPRIRPEQRRSSFHGMSTVDSDGRVIQKQLLSLLGWQRGDELDYRIRDGLVVIGRPGSRRLRVHNDGNLRITSEIRRSTGIRAGDRVLMTADTEHGRLVVFPLYVLDAMVIDRLVNRENGGEK
ncbi:hypothetical protein [Nocardia sp. NPDC051832]|uniref:hypothetical protein n=1 Tax=Nocardia sp. NPDC051832 TaxID=3155673 RepID=UPI00344A525B